MDSPRWWTTYVGVGRCRRRGGDASRSRATPLLCWVQTCSPSAAPHAAHERDRRSSRRRANRRPPGPGSPESRERGNASAGEGRIGCAMTRAARLAAAPAACGRVRSTETATVPHAGTSPPVLSPRSPTPRSLASSEGSSPYEPGQPGCGRQRRDHQRRPTSLGRRATNHRILRRILRRRRRFRDAAFGRRWSLHRNRGSSTSSASRRSRTQQERRRFGEHLRRGWHQDPGWFLHHRPGTSDQGERRRRQPGSSSQAGTHVDATNHVAEGRHDPSGPEHNGRRSRITTASGACRR
jgi:hypothetical protein